MVVVVNVVIVVEIYVVECVMKLNLIFIMGEILMKKNLKDLLLNLNVVEIRLNLIMNKLLLFIALTLSVASCNGHKESQVKKDIEKEMNTLPHSRDL